MPAFSFVHADTMTLGNDVEIRRFVYIHVRELSLGANTIVSYGSQIKGRAGFSCADNCFIGIHCLIHCEENVSLGFYSGLGPRCTVYTHGSFLPVTMGYPAKFAPVIIEDHVWIAMGVTVMPGALIKRNCIINPGVVVQGRIRENSILQFNPREYSIYDLSRFQRLTKRDVPYWHHQIISAYLSSLGASYQHDAETASYAVPGRCTFISRPNTNSIELHVGRERILYDLEQFYADESRRLIHKKFLSFIRLRYGVTLRTKYR